MSCMMSALKTDVKKNPPEGVRAGRSTSARPTTTTVDKFKLESAASPSVGRSYFMTCGNHFLYLMFSICLASCNAVLYSFFLF